MNALSSPKKSARIISMWKHSGWGNTIYFSNWDKRHVSGHMTPVPQKGDILRCKMESGKVARFKIIQLKTMIDPKDQFFAVVSDLDYEN